jgi:ABC-type multidrug transport system fused ATPase/permease subunit
MYNISLATLRKEGALRGIIFGVVLLMINIGVIYYTAYVVKSPGAFFGVSFVTSYIVQVGLAVFLISNLRTKIGGFWNLKQAVTGIFFMLFVTYLISSTGRFLFSRYIDSVTVNKEAAATIDLRRKALESTQASPENIKQTIAELQKSIAQSKNITIATVAQNLIFSIILIFALSFIFAALFKREKVQTPQ